ncbi:hypothetical protein ATK36_2015 [Amycolatopsis sulphurea]|uniref:Uncharacterized protein n=2 Tax=Amycolatopsis sulphurea TaxID=76022 RepID=A0A2A9F994_9PSEU|nr:hypothetical protein ATK36_2015 [Amycolatopsis sulphurea]
MNPVQTLHDFTLTLLRDPAALAAFGQDPQSALAAAGLGDISAADVREVLSLVLDYVPAGSPAALGQVPAAGDLTGAAVDGPQGAIDQLHALTASLGLPAVGEPSLPSAGDLPSVPGAGELQNSEIQNGELQNAAASAAALAQQPGSVFGLGGDLSHGLDAAPVARAAGAVGQVQHAVGEVGAAAPATPASPGAVDAAQAAGHLTDAGGGVAGHGSDLAGTATQNVGSLSGALSAQGVNHVADAATHQVQALTHTAPDWGSESSQHGADAGVGAVHDTVSQVPDVAHQGPGSDLHAGAETSHSGELHLSF